MAVSKQRESECKRKGLGTRPILQKHSGDLLPPARPHLLIAHSAVNSPMDSLLIQSHLSNTTGWESSIQHIKLLVGTLHSQPITAPKPKIFTLWSFTENVCWPSFYVVQNLGLNFYLKLHYFLLAYYCYTEDTLWHLQRCLQYILVRFTPSIILLYTLSPHL
jgi:hypothetical protein